MPAEPPVRAEGAAQPGVAVDRSGVAGAATVIRPWIRVTPWMQIAGEEMGSAGRIVLKLEHLQHSGSFKARGAFTNLLTRDLPAGGVVAASGGNHGAAVAYAAMRLGVRATIFVPSISAPAKVARIRGYGAELVIAGERYADALEASEAWRHDHAALAIHAYDQHETLRGQGTVAMELEEQAGGVDTILVPVGGGGLIGGIAAWYAGSTRVVAVEPELAPTLMRAVEAGRPVDAEAGGIAADALAPRRVGELVFPLVRRWVDRVVLVSDDAIREAQRTLWDRMRLAVEPAGATALAALICGAYRPDPRERVAVVLSGGNASPTPP